MYRILPIKNLPEYVQIEMFCAACERARWRRWRTSPCVTSVLFSRPENTTLPAGSRMGRRTDYRWRYCMGRWVLWGSRPGSVWLVTLVWAQWGAKLYKESSPLVVCHTDMTPRVLPVATVLLAVFGTAAAFLATPLNTTDPDVAAILCPEQVLPPTKGPSFVGPSRKPLLLVQQGTIDYWGLRKKSS